MKKVLYTLNINDYAPQVRELTYPLLKFYARKIGAEFFEITERRYPGWPVAYEKLQIWTLARRLDADWNIFLDADALIHPDTVDFTTYLPRECIAHNGTDFASLRWRYDEYFWRDTRNIGSCNWCSIASRWCLDLWHPLEDLTLAEALDRIQPTQEERNCGLIDREHLLDDYVLSRNIARYGLKVQTLTELQKVLGLTWQTWFWHAYTIPIEDFPTIDPDGNPVLDKDGRPVMKPGKVSELKNTRKLWGIADDFGH